MRAALPFKLNTSTATISFYLGFVCGLKHGLPRQIYPFDIVANVSHLFLHEALTNFGIDALKYPSTIGQGSLSSLLRRSPTEEPDLHGPGRRVSIFVMQRDRPVSRILGGGVDITTLLAARCGII